MLKDLLNQVFSRHHCKYQLKWSKVVHKYTPTICINLYYLERKAAWATVEPWKCWLFRREEILRDESKQMPPTKNDVRGQESNLGQMQVLSHHYITELFNNMRTRSFKRLRFLLPLIICKPTKAFEHDLLNLLNYRKLRCFWDFGIDDWWQPLAETWTWALKCFWKTRLFDIQLRQFIEQFLVFLKAGRNNFRQLWTSQTAWTNLCTFITQRNMLVSQHMIFVRPHEFIRIQSVSQSVS